ncbi:MAG: hypothetical protein LBM93_14770, partial [Oscillospiraceae bacterium]|nr:hypothetical protein [Oscillospiraceae bacterium]
MAHKVAVNFPIKDDDVYNNLVVPYKESKDLPGLLEGLIYSYYYSEEFRTLFDEVVYGVEYEVIRDDEEFNAAIKKAQEAVALYDILASSAEDFLNDSMDDINQKLSAVAAVT